MMRWIPLLLLFFSFNTSGLQDAPAVYKGRIRPADTVARLWLSEVSKKTSGDGISALELLWNKDDESPLIWVGSAETKRGLKLDVMRNRFSLNELKGKELTDEVQARVDLYRRFELLLLPGEKEWLPLSTRVNRSLYTEEVFQEVKRNPEKLLDAYSVLEGKPYLYAAGKALHYPTKMQLKAERLYMQLPLIEIAIALYLLALLFPRMMPAAFLLHTAILAIRMYILGRPPVSNMFETVLYVPWVAVAASFFLPGTRAVSAGSAALLLTILKVSGLEGSLENVQAVLDSQFWLTIHVLMVVGSYGLFCLAGLLAHGYLIRGRIDARLLLKTLYLGVAMLIPGTILGGVWAAESWGRFWDWDPKESWAFISACVYLLVIHAYTFGFVGSVGLAVGSIAGLVAISFTWYGVNYILGTGLHTYGFGEGGWEWYAAYLLAEGAFIAFALAKNSSFMINRPKITLGSYETR